MRSLKKKPSYPICSSLRKYLSRYSREVDLPIQYSDLLRWNDAFPVLDKEGKDTLWQSVIFDSFSQEEINEALTQIYALLNTEGDTSLYKHLGVARIDYCLFGNSNPFRIKIINQLNDNYDYFYIKKADASRVYGLELEHILSPNRLSYIVSGDTLVEEHIAGIPGDMFIEKFIQRPDFFATGLAKEFVKFNERCFMMLLGDMRSYNYVIDITPDFDKEQYRTRVIDFDQFAYQGFIEFYKPENFPENQAIRDFVINTLPPQTVNQYQYEERMLMKRRYRTAKTRMTALLDILKSDTITKVEKLKELRKDLNAYHQTDTFNEAYSMGIMLEKHLSLMFVRPKITIPGNSEFK